MGAVEGPTYASMAMWEKLTPQSRDPAEEKRADKAKVQMGV